MEHLKKILYEINYIYDIYDDIKHTWMNLNDKKNIVKAYNNDDLLLLYKISKITKYTKTHYTTNNKTEIDYNDMINRYYAIIINDIRNINFEHIFNKQKWNTHDSKEYIEVVKVVLNIHIYNTEKLTHKNS